MKNLKVSKMGDSNLQTQLAALQTISASSIQKEDTIMLFDMPSNLVVPMYKEHERYIRQLFPLIEWKKALDGEFGLCPDDWETIKKELTKINPTLCSLEQNAHSNQPF